MTFYRSLGTLLKLVQVCRAVAKYPPSLLLFIFVWQARFRHRRWGSDCDGMTTSTVIDTMAGIGDGELYFEGGPLLVL